MNMIIEHWWKDTGREKKRNQRKTSPMIYLPRVVTGEKNSPTAAHEDRKRQLKWVPSVWGYSWATLPQVYKCGGLALQVGGWARGRQAVTVQKAKLWPQNRLSGIELGIGKGYEMTLGM